jgi:hypothetical protein
VIVDYKLTEDYIYIIYIYYKYNINNISLLKTFILLSFF